MQFLEGLSGLRQLMVNRQALLTGAVTAIASLRDLEDLSLWETGLREIDLQPLHGHQQLRKLNLAGIRLRRPGLRVFKSLPKLEWLMASGTGLSRVRKLVMARALPSVELRLS